jgi:hypothetical protein
MPWREKRFMALVSMILGKGVNYFGKCKFILKLFCCYIKLFLTGTPPTMAVTVPDCPLRVRALTVAEVLLYEVKENADAGATLQEEADPADRV